MIGKVKQDPVYDKLIELSEFLGSPLYSRMTHMGAECPSMKPKIKAKLILAVTTILYAVITGLSLLKKLCPRMVE